MNIGNYILAPAVRQAVPPPPPQATSATAQVTAGAAFLVAQNAATPTRTQTAGALQATGNTEQSRTGQGRKDTGENVDSQTNAVSARARGGSYGGRQRGGQVDVRV